MSQAIRYLQPDVVAQLANMELRAKLVVEGFLTGLHKSPYHGFSAEFSEHRPYMPGDDIKHLDWKAYGKTDRFSIKQFEEETNLKTHLIVDSSGSMGFASGGRISKLQYASYVAAALAYLMMHQRDAVGLIVYDESIHVSLPPRGTQIYLQTILTELEKLRAGKKTGTADSLNGVADRIRRRGLVIILSDLFDDIRDAVKALKHFRHRGHEVMMMQVLDPIERSFAFGNDAMFRDMETGEELMTQPWHIQRAYREQLKEFLDHIRRECLENRIDYLLLDTATPFDKALFEYLTKRKRIH